MQQRAQRHHHARHRCIAPHAADAPIARAARRANRGTLSTSHRVWRCARAACLHAHAHSLTSDCQPHYTKRAVCYEAATAHGMAAALGQQPAWVVAPVPAAVYALTSVRGVPEANFLWWLRWRWRRWRVDVRGRTTIICDGRGDIRSVPYSAKPRCAGSRREGEE